MRISLPAVLAASAVLGASAGAGIRFAFPAGDRLSLTSPENVREDHLSSAETDESQHQAVAPSDKVAGKSRKGGRTEKKHKDEAGSFFKFSRQFVAPIVRDGVPEAMIVLDVVLELSPGSGDSLYAAEPKLRDAVLRALLSQAGNGELQGMLTDPMLVEATRDAVLANVRQIIGDNVIAVLLMDVAYQPF